MLADETHTSLTGYQSVARTMSSKSAIICFAYENHKEFICKTSGKKKHSADCKFCKTTLTDVSGTTSNFYRHVQRKHKERIREYQRQQQQPTDQQPSIAGFARPELTKQAVQLYDASSPRQQEIHNAIIKDLLIGCTLPLSIVENQHFRHFLKVMDNKYTPIARKTITEKHIPLLVDQVKDSIKRKLQTQSSVSITADIWSDRTMRSFFGVTAHGLNQDGNQLESFLLDCRRFCGRHSGDNIAMAFDEIIDEYNIASKVRYIITDNAVNMKCAFKVKLPQEEQHSDGSDAEEENLDDESLWEDVTWEDETIMVRTRQRLSCFAHSLQLVVHDGMKEAKAFSSALTKMSKLTSLLHTSTTFKERFEAKFGTDRSIPAATSTRWNSTFKQLQALTALDHRDLTQICSSDFQHVLFSVREWNQLKNLGSVLFPFAEATDLTEGEKMVTISMVVPTVLDLNTHLLQISESQSHCRPLATSLRQSLLKRFSGIFVRTKMVEQNGKEDQFNHNVYFLATMLDPQFGLNWVDLDVTNNESPDSVKKFREDLKRTLIDSLTAEVEATADGDMLHSGGDVDETSDSPPGKCPRLLARYRAHKHLSHSAKDACISAQIHKYFDAIQNTDTNTALEFWSTNREKFPQLYSLVVKVLSIPASSAPVERVFSKGGLIVRPHRARLTHKMVTALVFLKSNMALV
ncbi:uncharacterized protein LOC132844154 isoform X1 [Tachysurus vachellii]|uniref:uncharacterized protein LOC132844154 isoform X1 n=3 Tax=Tachysurus vachellii TaxID=175792 RepID=UPI00296B3A42|nr:uncharacterized protein LOC132844154 isoform X1 [Tachysurus vachellii]